MRINKIQRFTFCLADRWQVSINDMTDRYFWASANHSRNLWAAKLCPKSYLLSKLFVKLVFVGKSSTGCRCHCKQSEQTGEWRPIWDLSVAATPDPRLRSKWHLSLQKWSKLNCIYIQTFKSQLCNFNYVFLRPKWSLALLELMGSRARRDLLFGVYAVTSACVRYFSKERFLVVNTVQYLPLAVSKSWTRLGLQGLGHSWCWLPRLLWITVESQPKSNLASVFLWSWNNAAIDR